MYNFICMIGVNLFDITKNPYLPDISICKCSLFSDCLIKLIKLKIWIVYQL